MKNKLRIIFWVLFISSIFSCSSIVTIFPHHKKTNPEFEKYLKQLPIDSGDLIIGFKEADGILDKLHSKLDNSTIAGFCGVSIFPLTKQVSINPKWWKIKSDKQKMALLIHEIGHCKYYKGHEDRKFMLNCPLTLMNSYTVSNRCLDIFWNYYMWEIKDRFYEN